MRQPYLAGGPVHPVQNPLLRSPFAHPSSKLVTNGPTYLERDPVVQRPISENHKKAAMKRWWHRQIVSRTLPPLPAEDLRSLEALATGDFQLPKKAMVDKRAAKRRASLLLDRVPILEGNQVSLSPHSHSRQTSTNQVKLTEEEEAWLAKHKAT